MLAKPWYQSSTYQGLIVMLIGLGLGYLGFTGEEIAGLKGEMAQILGLVGNLVGTIMIAHGRNKASTSIALTKSGADKYNAAFMVKVEPEVVDETDPLNQPE